MTHSTDKPWHFIRQIIEEDLSTQKHTAIITRFPPEPNGYLHVGHAKSICLNFGLAEEYQGVCNLRLDDTNPTKEEDEYVRAIMQDVRWLGYDWQEQLFHASDYFHQLYDFAVQLIHLGKAYVDSLSAEEIRQYRGTLTQPGKESPDRQRTIADNLDLFARMKAGEFKEGKYVLRAKIDMTSGNINLRDPVIYRILHAAHQRTGEAWCIYPMYDFAHPLSDALEGITHSLCTLEFQDHRPLYDWLIDSLQTPAKPRQIEFARLNLSHTITSKRKLRELVEEKLVHAWDDPRMPTLQGMRRRGYPPAAIRKFCEVINISKSDSVIDMSVLEECIRDKLNQQAPRAMAVLNPLKIIIDNYPESETLSLTIQNHPQNESLGKHALPFSREIIIEREDFMETPSKDFFRLAPGREVRLRHAYIIRCDRIVHDEQTGEVIALHCSYDPDTLGKNPSDRKVKGVIHWLAANEAHSAEIRLYDRLFLHDNPGSQEDYRPFLNPQSLTVIANASVEPALAQAKPYEAFQFERLGYFSVDPDSQPRKMVFNRIVSLRDPKKNS